MGVRDVLIQEPAELVRRLARDPAEMVRRARARARAALLRDDIETLLRNAVHAVFEDDVTRRRVSSYIPLVGAGSQFRKIVEDVNRHTYSPAPTRELERERDTVAYTNIAKQTRMNQTLGLAMTLSYATNLTFVWPRYIPRLKTFLLQNITPDMVSVVPDPDDPLRELAVIVDMGQSEHDQQHRMFWDDEEVVLFDGKFNLIQKWENPYGRLPFVPIHRRERWGCYWDTTSGRDMLSGTLLEAFSELLAIKFLKSQGFKQIVISGETELVPEDQVLDEESALIAPENTSMNTLDLSGDARRFIELAESIANKLGAGHGLSKERLNAEAKDAADDTSLMERRQERITQAVELEHSLLEMWGSVSTQHHDESYRLSGDASFSLLDFGDLESRLSLSEQIKLWDKMERLGMISVPEMILANDPEVSTLAEAMEKYQWRMSIREERIELERQIGGAPEAPLLDDPDHEQKPAAAKGLPPGNGVRGYAQQ